MDAMRLAKKAGIEFEIQDRPPAQNTSVADALREKLGHYLGATLYYGGEWYWGLDRLHYLEERLTTLGVRKDGVSSPIYTPPGMPAGRGKTDTELHWYLSFRSPYSAIVRSRVKALADAYRAVLKIRFVLPMVMRGLPVPPAKKKISLWIRREKPDGLVYPLAGSWTRSAGQSSWVIPFSLGP